MKDAIQAYKKKNKLAKPKKSKDEVVDPRRIRNKTQSLGLTLVDDGSEHPLLEDGSKPRLAPATRQWTQGQLLRAENRASNVHLKKAFLEAYRQCGYITEAAPAAGIERRTHYYWMENDLEYAKTFADLELDVRARILDETEREIQRRAIDGYIEPVFGSLGSDSEGRSLGTGIVGRVRKHSDLLLIFKAKGEMPAKYKDKQDATTVANTQVIIEVVYTTPAGAPANQVALPVRVAQQVIPAKVG